MSKLVLMHKADSIYDDEPVAMTNRTGGMIFRGHTSLP